MNKGQGRVPRLRYKTPEALFTVRRGKRRGQAHHRLRPRAGFHHRSVPARRRADGNPAVTAARSF